MRILTEAAGSAPEGSPIAMTEVVHCPPFSSTERAANPLRDLMEVGATPMPAAPHEATAQRLVR
eukprot:9564509-Lingulodinium_polyedra.AAC.1